MKQVISLDYVTKYKGNLPRYTSYPTAVQFSEAVGYEDYKNWLQALSTEEPVSLYLHVPFCDELCRFCACNTLVMRREEARESYGDLLCEELSRLASLLSKRRSVKFIHWGGGTPTTLPIHTMIKVMNHIHSLFEVKSIADISIELDPRHVSIDYLRVLRDLGITRVSFGVQDLDEQVQKACGRIQSLEQTQYCVDSVREQGIRSINIDLIYGLPNQTLQSTQNTIELILKLRPDRLAVFGYAHVPWKHKRQTLLEDEILPNAFERFQQRQFIDYSLRQAGYISIGFDHYALPHDEMSKAAKNGNLHRNFQGYTVDNARALLAVGASSISILPQGIVQNAITPADYKKALTNSRLPIVRGVARNAEDRLRWEVIERLMCDLTVDLKLLAQKYQQKEDFFEETLTKLKPFEKDKLVSVSNYIIQVTEQGRPFLRNIAVIFDTYYLAAPQRHAQAI